jgi:putative flippase GtrA
MRKFLGKLSPYLLTGGGAAIVDTGGFALLESVSVITPIAATVSFCFAALVNYLLTARFVFGQQTTAKGRIFCEFLYEPAHCLSPNT